MARRVADSLPDRLKDPRYVRYSLRDKAAAHISQDLVHDSAATESSKAAVSEPIHISSRAYQEPDIEEMDRTKRNRTHQHTYTDMGSTLRVNPKIREYFRYRTEEVEGETWMYRDEIPTSAEVMDQFEYRPGDSAEQAIEFEPNRAEGPWDDKKTYLSAHYELLREDAIRPLREAVVNIRQNPRADEDTFTGTIGLYDNVCVTGVIFSTRGLAVTVEFSLSRAGKRIHWEQSKRLISGSIVALSPVSDVFRTECVVAVVAARPLAGLEQNPPQIDLFFPREKELILDTSQEWLMVEDRTSYYEASRHTLLALQRLMKEPFPLSQHIVDARKEVPPPMTLVHNSELDMRSIFKTKEGVPCRCVDVLTDWPDTPETELDDSQQKALRRILTKQLAIIQGPPGTGKTHVSVAGLRVMVENMQRTDPPVIVACQTNHALDQFLRHVAKFESNFIRLGGRSKDQAVVKQRTLYEVRKVTSSPPVSGCLKGPASKSMKAREQSISILLAPLEKGRELLETHLLKNLGIITEEQAKSIDTLAQGWVESGWDPSKQSTMSVWLGDQQVPARQRHITNVEHFEFEEADLEFEMLKELEVENITKDDDDTYESLSGNRLYLADNWTGRVVQGFSEEKLLRLTAQPDLSKVPAKYRGNVYRYYQRRVKEIIFREVRKEAAEFNRCARDRRIGGWEQDYMLLKQQKVIGLTTTGLSKYRALIASLEPRVVLIEEAAETLEAPIVAGLVPSVQQLILVGDHQQLRPHCAVKEHEGEPWFLNVSMFERLIKNEVEFDILRIQRRMIPEIRRVLHPIYADLLEDHPCVSERPSVPGMNVNSYFYTHEWPESRDEFMSCWNKVEVDMIVGFVDYLIHNGVKPSQITVLTFYNGQRKRLLRGLRSHPNMSSINSFKVVTVDSYQGEENDIVLLSLVRSNDVNKIGFLGVDNRVCVALSRARCGFYIFGNGRLLAGESKTWSKVVAIMAGKHSQIQLPPEPHRRLGFKLPVQCQNHGHITFIEESNDWSKMNGGCTRICADILPCGHACHLKCHAFDHKQVNCIAPCERQLSCGHSCSADICSDPCRCKTCREDYRNALHYRGYQPIDPGHVEELAMDEENELPIQPSIDGHAAPFAPTYLTRAPLEQPVVHSYARSTPQIRASQPSASHLLQNHLQRRAVHEVDAARSPNRHGLDGNYSMPSTSSHQSSPELVNTHIDEYGNLRGIWRDKYMVVEREDRTRTPSELGSQPINYGSTSLHPASMTPVDRSGKEDLIDLLM